jgi:hypothetical protein
MDVVALVISVIPTAGLNQKYTGSWTGDPGNLSQIQIQDPIAAFLGNSLLLGQQLFMPPFLLNVRQVDAGLNQLLPDCWKRELEKGFPLYSTNHLNELPQEEAASLGIGITLLLLASVVALWCQAGKKNQSTETQRWKLSSVGLAAWVASLFFMLKMGSEADARLMLPYYPLVMIPILTLPGQDRLVRRAGWRILALLVSLSVLPGLILTPSRPLWPVQTISGWLSRSYPDSSFTRRLTTVYSCYQNRNDLLAPLRATTPITLCGAPLDSGGWFTCGMARLKHPSGYRRLSSGSWSSVPSGRTYHLFPWKNGRHNTESKLCFPFRSRPLPAEMRKPGVCCISENRDGAGLGRSGRLPANRQGSN